MHTHIHDKRRHEFEKEQAGAWQSEGKKGKGECDVISLKLKFKRAEKNIFFTLKTRSERDVFVNSKVDS